MKTKRMLQKMLFTYLIILLSIPVFGQKNTNERAKWFTDSRFGMFIHWGVYSGAEGIWKGEKIRFDNDYAEWIYYRNRINKEEYVTLLDKFDWHKIDPEAWVLLAKKAGMKYVTITAKHHDGFALWDSRVTDYDIAEYSNPRRDIIKDLSEACKKHGLKMGLYYSHWVDWEHPYGWDHTKEIYGITDTEYDQYWQEKVIPQMRELLSNYGDIGMIWFDRFNMFASKYTDYNIVNTPYGKDIIKEWVDAFRSEGLGVGFYYSLIDWHHPEYTIDRVHPQRVESQEEYDKLNKGRDMGIYRKYLKNQVREILTNYGKIDILWLDYSFPGQFGKDRDDWDSVELLKMVRKLQPDILVNDRADLKDYWGGWDFTTPEQFKVQKWPEIEGERIPWETCQTFSGSWGYYRDEHTWKDTKQLLVLLIESVSKGGNLLLNVGPTARGTFDDRANKALSEMGKWMKYNSRSIYGCTQAPDEFTAPDHTLLTYNPEINRLYIHLLDYPMKNFLLKEFGDKVKYAQFLHDASEIKMGKPHGYWIQQETSENDINLLLPVNKPDIEIPVIELYLK